MYVKKGNNALVLKVIQESIEPLTCREIVEKSGLFPEETKSVATIIAGYRRRGMVVIAGKKRCNISGYDVNLYQIKKLSENP